MKFSYGEIINKFRFSGENWSFREILSIRDFGV